MSRKFRSGGAGRCKDIKSTRNFSGYGSAFMCVGADLRDDFSRRILTENVMDAATYISCVFKRVRRCVFHLIGLFGFLPHLEAGRFDKCCFILPCLVGECGSFVLVMQLPSQMELSVWSGTFRGISQAW